MKTVFIAGATGYLGQFLCAEYRRRGWQVLALVRNAAGAQQPEADRLIQAQATQAETLVGTMDGVDLVVSALGITRQTDGLTYNDVDYQANLNLLEEAQRAGVQRFAYIHVLNAEKMPDVSLVAAKAAFVRELLAASIPSTVIAPSGYFSDMGDFMAMAKSGRVWLFGSGSNRLNPIHGADLAVASANAIDNEEAWLDVGGPDTYTHREIAQLAFAPLNGAARITCMPDALRRLTLSVLPWVTPRRVHGPAHFFLTAMGMDMVGHSHGTHHLADHFARLAQNDSALRVSRS